MVSPILHPNTIGRSCSFSSGYIGEYNYTVINLYLLVHVTILQHPVGGEHRIGGNIYKYILGGPAINSGVVSWQLLGPHFNFAGNIFAHNGNYSHTLFLRRLRRSSCQCKRRHHQMTSRCSDGIFSKEKTYKNRERKMYCNNERKKRRKNEKNLNNKCV